MLRKGNGIVQAIEENSTKLVNKGGRPRKTDYIGTAKDDGQAFENAKYKWNYLSMYLADQALASAKGDKKGLAQLVTSAAIAFDKAFSKREADQVTISIPATLAQSLTLALKLQAHTTSDNKSYGNVSVPAPGPGPATDSQLILNSGTVQGAGTGQGPGVGLLCDRTGGAGASKEKQSADAGTVNFSETEKG